MKRRTFSREFKLEAVKLVTERGVAVVQACRDLELSESVLRRWMREVGDTPLGAFPGHGRVSREQAEIVALRKEVARLKAERDILKRRPRSSRGMRHEVRFRRQASACLARELDLRRLAGLPLRLPCLVEPARLPGPSMTRS